MVVLVFYLYIQPTVWVTNVKRAKISLHLIWCSLCTKIFMNALRNTVVVPCKKIMNLYDTRYLQSKPGSAHSYTLHRSHLWQRASWTRRCLDGNFLFHHASTSVELIAVSCSTFQQALSRSDLRQAASGRRKWHEDLYPESATLLTTKIENPSRQDIRKSKSSVRMQNLFTMDTEMLGSTQNTYKFILNQNVRPGTTARRVTQLQTWHVLDASPSTAYMYIFNVCVTELHATIYNHVSTCI